MLVVRNLIHQKKLLSKKPTKQRPKEENLDAEFESKSYKKQRKKVNKQNPLNFSGFLS
jgi:hypothetical protein